MPLPGVRVLDCEIKAVEPNCGGFRTPESKVCSDYHVAQVFGTVKEYLGGILALVMCKSSYTNMIPTRKVGSNAISRHHR